MGKTEVKKRKLPNIPLLHDYNGAFYYERAGYQEYYDLVKDLIVDKRHECVQQLLKIGLVKHKTNKTKGDTINARLILFRVADSHAHPVKASDIIYTLKKLDFIDKKWMKWRWYLLFQENLWESLSDKI